MGCYKCDEVKDDKYTILRQEMFVSDDGLYEHTCPDGHSNVTILRNLQFEILFEIGINAIIDGYFRESVSAFSASLERFNEFYISILGKSQGVSNDVDKAWKSISNSSERQFGAFVLSYTLVNGEAPKVLKNKDSKFRNKVIHEGKIPTRAEAIQYGDKIQRVIRPILKKMHDFYENEIEAEVENRVSELQSLRKDNGNMGVLTVPTYISLSPYMDVVRQMQPLSEYVNDIGRFERSPLK